MGFTLVYPKNPGIGYQKIPDGQKKLGRPSYPTNLGHSFRIRILFRPIIDLYEAEMIEGEGSDRSLIGEHS